MPSVVLAIINSMRNDRISCAIGVAYKIVGISAHSCRKKRDLIKVQIEMDLPHHCLVTECITHWGTHYKMLNRILEQETALVQILGADPKAIHLKPTLVRHRSYGESSLGSKTCF